MKVEYVCVCVITITQSEHSRHFVTHRLLSYHFPHTYSHTRSTRFQSEWKIPVKAEVSSCSRKRQIEEHLVQAVKCGRVVSNVELVGEQLVSPLQERQILQAKNADGTSVYGGTRVTATPGSVGRDPGLFIWDSI